MSQRVKNNSHATRLRRVSYYFLLFTRCDVICNLLQYTHTGKCNPNQRNATTQRNATQRNNTTQRNPTQRNTTQRNATQHNTTQHNTTQHNIYCSELLSFFNRIQKNEIEAMRVWCIVVFMQVVCPSIVKEVNILRGTHTLITDRITSCFEKDAFKTFIIL